MKTQKTFRATAVIAIALILGAPSAMAQIDFDLVATVAAYNQYEDEFTDATSQHEIRDETDLELAACFQDALASGDFPSIESAWEQNLAEINGDIPASIGWAGDNGAPNLGEYIVFMTMGMGDGDGTGEGYLLGYADGWGAFFGELGNTDPADYDLTTATAVEAMYDACLDEGSPEGIDERIFLELVGADEVGVNRERLYFAKIVVPDGFQDNGDPLTTTQIQVTLTWTANFREVLDLNDDKRSAGGAPRIGANAVTTVLLEIEDGGPALPADLATEAANEAAATSYGVGIDYSYDDFIFYLPDPGVQVTAVFEAIDAGNPNTAVVALVDEILVTVSHWDWWEGCDPADSFGPGYVEYASWYGCGIFDQSTNVDVLDTDAWIGDGIPDGWQLELLAYALCNKEGYGDVFPKAEYPGDAGIAAAFESNLTMVRDWFDNAALTASLLRSAADELQLSPGDSFPLTVGVQLPVTATSGEGDTLFNWSSSAPTVAQVSVLDPNSQDSVVVTALTLGSATITCEAMGTPLAPKLAGEGLLSTVGVGVVALPDPNADPVPPVPCPPGAGLPPSSTGTRETAGIIADLQTVIGLWVGGAQAEADPGAGGVFTAVPDFDAIDLPIASYPFAEMPMLRNGWDFLATMAFASPAHQSAIAGLGGLTSDQNWTLVQVLDGWFFSVQNDVGTNLNTITTELQAMSLALTQELLNNGFVSGWLVGDGITSYPELAAFSTAVMDALALITTINRGDEGDPWTVTTPGVGLTPNFLLYAWNFGLAETEFSALGDYNSDTMDHGTVAALVKAAGGNKTDFVNGATGQSDFWKGNPMLPVTGLVGLGLLAGAFAVSGAALIRRKRS